MPSHLSRFRTKGNIADITAILITRIASQEATDSAADGIGAGTPAASAEEDSEWAPPGGASAPSAKSGADDNSESWAPSVPESSVLSDSAGFSFSKYSKGLAGAAIKTATQEKKTTVSAIARCVRERLGRLVDCK